MDLETLARTLQKNEVDNLLYGKLLDIFGKSNPFFL
jgi:hypothetical protein